MIQKTKLKKIFHDVNVQINVEAVNMLDDTIKRIIVSYASNCKNGNVKRLTPELMWVALGNINITRNEK
tara:strand:- start:1433 stop:1639 length:207 start_codon:yes stop_codon:yes gene_type:complete